MHARATTTPERKDTLLDRIERWLRNQPVFAALILAGTSVIAISEVAQHGSDLLVLLNLRQERVLTLAAKNAKGEFYRRLIAQASRRIWGTRNY